MIYIKDLEEKQPFKQPLMVISVLNGVTNQGSPYLSMTLQDQSGTIEGKLWNVTPTQEAVVKVGSVIMIDGDVLKYRGKLQLRIKDVSSINQDEIDLSHFIMASDISKDELKKRIQNYRDQITNQNLRIIVETLFERYGDDFFVYPAAAKNHHDFVGGLANHTLEMCDIARGICEVFPSINKELLLSGILIHDFKKIDEYISPVVVEYSTEGKLLGHISMLAAEIYEIAKAHAIEDSQEVLLLRHMVLSHHGKLEFGSPVLPQILEAEVLSLIDDMDARIQMFEKNLQTVEKGEFTTRIFPLENRFLYHHSLEEEVEEE